MTTLRNSNKQARLQPRRCFPSPDSRQSLCRRLRTFLTSPLNIMGLAAGAAMLTSLACTAPAFAQQGIYAAGDPIVTGFSGIRPPDGPLPPAVSPLDEFFIDLDGDSMKILKPQSPAVLEAQLVPAPPAFRVKARDVGQVFAIGLEDTGNGQTPPHIYLGATSAFGIQIVTPDADGDGRPERTARGAPAATFMAGQFGTGEGAGPGSVWRVDSLTGAVTPFANLDNSGPGIGDIVYDKATRQFFVSDLDSGLIQRLDASGAVLDSFDHGTIGRPAAALAPVADDGTRMDITSPAFNAEDPSTWGFTQKERMVWGMATRGGRLYYAVAGAEVWSIGILLDGGFANDARIEFDVESAGASAISDMSFDARGRLYLAQRGTFRGSYDYSVFAEPAKSAVLRYRREMPDDPGTRGTWVPDAEAYAIGFPAEYRNATGGVALGYGQNGTCDERLWSIGDNLRNNPANADRLASGGPAEVHGLQINPIELVRPQNEPPFTSYFIDYDGQFGDAEKAGHVGDVEIWQSCKGQTGFGNGYSIPPYGELPPGYTPPSYDTFNLRLTKRARPRDCVAGGGGWFCFYTVRVTNTGPGAYLGPVTVYDQLPGAPAGVSMSFDFQPPWNCVALAAHEHECTYPPVLLFPGDSLDLYVTVKLPGSYPDCRLENVAAISWPFGFGDANPADDTDWAVATIPSKRCEPKGKQTNLRIEKKAMPPKCWKIPGGYRCGYLIRVTNTGPGQYNDQIQITDTVPAGTTAIFSGPLWACAGGPVYTCTHGVVPLNPGDSVFLPVRIDVPEALAKQMKCRVPNAVKITYAPGGSDQNTNPADDADAAVAGIPDKVCENGRPRTNLRLEKKVDANGCLKGPGGQHYCYYNVTVTNTGPGPYVGLLVVRDIIPAGATAVFSAGWLCADMNPQYTCIRNVNLPNPGNSVVMGVQVTVPDALARRMECRVPNQAKILFAPGGSPKNFNPADDQDGATANIPAEICRPQSTNLRVEKRANPQACSQADGGWQCTYEISVRNMGPSNYNDTISLSETLPAEPVNAGWNAPWNCFGMGGGGGATCNHPMVNILPGGTVSLVLTVTFSNDVVRRLSCRLLNQVAISHAPGGSANNTDPTDDTASAAATVPGDFCSTVPVPQTPKCPAGFRWDGERCNRGTPPPPPAGCARGEWLSKGRCCPIGREWNGRRCVPQDKPSCPPGTTGNYPSCVVIESPRCPSGWSGQPPVCCPPPSRFLNGQCVTQPDPDDTPQCGRGQYLSNGHCCPRGTIWNGKRCLRNPGLQPGCPRGTTGVFPDCKTVETPKCPQGTTGRFPNCAPVRTCPGGTIGKYPNCRPVQVLRCPAGTRGVYPNCEPIVRKCPPGFVGTPPLCRRLSQICPSGTVRSGGACIKVPTRPTPAQQQPRLRNLIDMQRDKARQSGPQIPNRTLLAPKPR